MWPHVGQYLWPRSGENYEGWVQFEKFLGIYDVGLSGGKGGIAEDECIRSETYQTNSLSCIFGESEPKESALHGSSKVIPYLHVVKDCGTKRQEIAVIWI